MSNNNNPNVTETGIDLFDKLDSLNDSDIAEVDNNKVETEAKLELLNFLKGCIQKINHKNTLKDAVIDTLFDRINPDLNDTSEGDIKPLPLTNQQLINLLAVITKGETESSNSILQILKQNVIIATAGDPPITIPPAADASKAFTKEDIQAAKNVLDFMNNVKESDISPEEKKSPKE